MLVEGTPAGTSFRSSVRGQGGTVLCCCWFISWTFPLADSRERCVSLSSSFLADVAGRTAPFRMSRVDSGFFDEEDPFQVCPFFSSGRQLVLVAVTLRLQLVYSLKSNTYTY